MSAHIAGNQINQYKFKKSGHEKNQLFLLIYIGLILNTQLSKAQVVQNNYTTMVGGMGLIHHSLRL